METLRLWEDVSQPWHSIPGHEAWDDWFPDLDVPNMEHLVDDYASQRLTVRHDERHLSASAAQSQAANGTHSSFSQNPEPSNSRRTEEQETLVQLPLTGRYPRSLHLEPTSQDALAAEVKGIYAGLVMVEAKCISIDAAQAINQQSQLGEDQWQGLVAFHRTLLYEHHHFFMITQHPSATPALRDLATKYNMPARLWKHGIHEFLEFLQQRTPESHEYMLAFIYIAYQMMALLFETVPAFSDTWIECLGDLAQYRMAIGKHGEAYSRRLLVTDVAVRLNALPGSDPTAQNQRSREVLQGARLTPSQDSVMSSGPSFGQTESAAHNDHTGSEIGHLSLRAELPAVYEQNLGVNEKVLANPDTSKMCEGSAPQNVAPATEPGRFQCPNCSKDFKRHCDLKKHLKSHLPDEERPHVCLQCGKGFLWPKDLIRHDEVHQRVQAVAGDRRKRKAPQMDDPIEITHTAQEQSRAALPPVLAGPSTGIQPPPTDLVFQHQPASRPAKRRRCSDSFLSTIPRPLFPDDGSAPHRGARV